jgi:hypothetical protein
MEPVLEGGNDPKVSAATTQTPEEIFVLLLARLEEFAIGGDDISRD